MSWSVCCALNKSAAFAVSHQIADVHDQVHIISRLCFRPRYIFRKWMGSSFLMEDYTGCVGEAVTGRRLYVPLIFLETEYRSCRGDH